MDSRNREEENSKEPSLQEKLVHLIPKYQPTPTPLSWLVARLIGLPTASFHAIRADANALLSLATAATSATAAASVSGLILLVAQIIAFSLKHDPPEQSILVVECLACESEMQPLLKHLLGSVEIPSVYDCLESLYRYPRMPAHMSSLLIMVRAVATECC